MTINLVFVFLFLFVFEKAELLPDEDLICNSDMSEKLVLENMEMGPYDTNTFVFTHEEHPNEIILIEAPPDSFKGLHKKLKKKPKIHLLLTHGHWDHVTDAHLFQKYGAHIYIHERDFKDWLSLDKGKVKKLDDKNLTLLKDEDELTILGEKIQVIHTPGHTMGSSCFYFERIKKLFPGDTLFRRGVGRTDMDFGSWDHIKKSINEKIYKLPEDVDVYPGHGAFTKIGDEKKHNQYV